MKIQFSALGIFYLLLKRYVDAVAVSNGRITEDCENIGYVIEFMANRYAISIGDNARTSLNRCTDSIKDILKRDSDWLLLPIQCAYYPNTYDGFKIGTALANLDHHKYSLRDYTMNCVYFIAKLLPFGHSTVLTRLKENINSGHMGLDKSLYINYLGFGNEESKAHLFQELYQQDDKYGWVKDVIKPYTENVPIANPFEAVDRYAMTYILDFVFNKIKKADDQILLDFVRRTRDFEDMKYE